MNFKKFFFYPFVSLFIVNLAKSNDQCSIYSNFNDQECALKKFKKDQEIDTMKNLLERFWYVKDKNEREILHHERKAEIYNSLIDGLEILGGGVPGPSVFMAGLAGVGLRKFVDYETQKAITRLKENSESFLEGTLSAYRAHSSQAEFESLFHMPIQEGLNKVFSDGHVLNAISGRTFQNLSNNEQALLLATTQKILGDTLTKEHYKNKLEHSKTRDYVEEELKASSERVMQLSQYTLGVHKSVTQQYENIAQALSFSQMSPEEKQEALEKGWFPNLSIEERETLVKQELGKQVVGFLGNVSNGINDLQIIARGFGLDPDLVNGLAVIGRMTSTAMSVTTGIMSGNYLQVAASIVGFFTGFGGSDIEAERHAEIMAGIGQILRTQEILRKGIVSLLEGQELLFKNQKNILNNQKIILEAVQNLHKDFLQSHSDLSERLVYVKRKLGDVQKTCREAGIEKELNYCFIFLGEKGNSKSLKSMGHSRTFDNIKDYESLKPYYDDQKRMYYDFCEGGLTSLFNAPDMQGSQDFHSLFYLRNYEHSKTPEIENLWQNYDKVYGYCNRYYDELSKGDKSLKKNSTSQENSFQDLFPNNILSDSLYPDMIRKYTLILMEVFPFEKMANGEKKLVSQEHYSQYFKEDSILFPPLKQSRRLIEFALLQQELLSGRLCMESFLLDLESQDKEKRESLYSLLEKNPLIAANLFTESLHRMMEKKEYTFLAFALHLHPKQSVPGDLMNLEYNFDGLWHFAFDNNVLKFFFRIDPSQIEKEYSYTYHENGTIKTAFRFDPSKEVTKEEDLKSAFPIPHIDMLRDKKHLHSGDKNNLIELRSKLLERLIEHDIILGQGSEDERALWMELSQSLK